MPSHPMTHLLVDLALEAGAKIAEIYATNFDVSVKGDGSAVTQADCLGEEIILNGLAEKAPDVPVLAEEAASKGNIPELGQRFFLVDPLDGTREFVNRTGEFTVNIALIEHGAPVLGVVYAPGSEKLYFGCATGGAFRQSACPGSMRSTLNTPEKIAVRRTPQSGPVGVASRSHRTPETDEFLRNAGVTDFTPAGSSLKFCLIAEGDADVYPRLGRTMEWDTGAAQAVLEAAGGQVLELQNNIEIGPLRYNKIDRGFDNPHFVAWGGR